LHDAAAAGAGAGRIPPGTALGTYAIEAFVGAGGMGEVYRARDVRLHRTVAVKILRPVRSEGGDTAEVTTRLEDGGKTVAVRRRFEVEARAASALDHPNICTIYDIGEQDGLCFIAMEWIDGGTIGDLIPSWGLPVEQAFGLARQVVEGIAAAHRVGIVHRDIKPANILVTSSGAAKIVDFGLAKVSVPGIGAGAMAPGEVAAVPRVEGPVATTTTMDGRPLGTPGYAPPEQIEGRPLDARADVFALGCVIYEMFAGCRAFPAVGVRSPVEAVLEGRPVALRARRRDVPRRVEAIVSKAISASPAARYPSAVELLADLEAAFRPHAARQVPLHAALHRPAVTIALAVVVAAAVGGAWWLRQRDAREQHVRGTVIPESKRCSRRARPTRSAPSGCSGRRRRSRPTTHS
jgi:serine/threonine protein kinase